INYKTIKDIATLKNARVLLRLDLNLVMDQHQKIIDDSRMRLHLPTLLALLEQKAKILILAHLGRPKGQVKAELSLGPIALHLSTMLNMDVPLLPLSKDRINPSADIFNDTQIMMLENLRFDQGEEANDPDFAKYLSQFGDYYVNDAFSVSHRAHASIDQLARLLPAYAGFAMDKELQYLTRALAMPKRPLTAFIGGAKVSTKLQILHHLLEVADAIAIGGGMANTFLAAQGLNVGLSRVEKDLFDDARLILESAKKLNKTILLPCDYAVAPALDQIDQMRLCRFEDLASNECIFDLGPQSMIAFQEHIKKSHTLVWNGPLGVFESPPFDRSTCALMEFTADLVEKNEIMAIAGGGDTLAALAHAKQKERFSYVSGAGGAFLEWLGGSKLPGIMALNQD
ncbi:MAG: phosphoglycerate kinase, partial [Pseudomonadota bacterium]